MRVSLTDMLVGLARSGYELFHDASGEAWASDGTQIWKIASTAFSQRLGAELFRASGKAASKSALSSAANTLAGMAILEGEEHPVGLRIAACEGAVVVDLADAEHRVVVIGPGGWEIAGSSPVRFHRPSGMLALPEPEKGGDLRELSELWPLSGSDLTLALGWVLGAYNPQGSKPLLDLAGVQGSGKSLLARMIRSLVDPHSPELQTMPRDLRNLAVVCSHHALPVFDNVSRLGGEVQDGLCRLASGAGFEHRKLYTDDDLAVFSATRPIIITGIPEVASQGDLADRTISIVLAQMGEGERETEQEILARFEELRPRLLGVIFDAVSAALANMPTTLLREAPRMLDFATWVEAGAPALGWEPGRFLDAYVSNRLEAAVGVVESSVVATYIHTLAEEGFAGTSAKCLARLAEIAGPEVTRGRGWPATPRGLTNALRRLAPSLAATGVVVEFEGGSGHRARIVRLSLADGADGAVLAFAKPTAGSAQTPTGEGQGELA